LHAKQGKHAFLCKEIMMERKKILIAPLDWGIGHATRCIPVIKKKLNEGHDIVLASNGRSKALLQSHFPELQFIDGIPDYAITYSETRFFMGHLMKQIPHILRAIKNENSWLKNAISKHRIDEVISDNRYGLYNTNIQTSIITHQILPIGPALLAPITHRIIKKYISHFDTCLIPDFEEESISLSGKLSHGNIPGNSNYIGPLSRFQNMASVENKSETIIFDYLIILSGPEPQRSKFEELMIRIFDGQNANVCLIGGKPEQNQSRQKNNIKIIPHLLDTWMKTTIDQSKNIITRSGYSTLMDLHALGRIALLIPTPGQTEQAYLAERHSNKFGFTSMSQDEISFSNIEHIFRTQ